MQLSNRTKLLSITCIIWLFFIVLILFGNYYDVKVWEKICELIQISITGSIILISLKLRSKLTSKSKKIFTYYILSTLFLFISSGTYYLSYYVLEVTDINNISISWSYLSPAVFWLFFDFFYWMKVIKLYENIFKNKLLLFTIIIINICFFYVLREVFVFWDVRMSQLTIIFQIYSSVLVFFIFNFALIALICSRTLGAHLLSAGTISIIGANFLTMYVSYSDAFNSVVYKNDFWLLSSLISLNGLLVLLMKKDFDMFKWFTKGNSIKSTVASWTLCIVSITFSLSFALANYFSMLKVEALPSLPYVTFIYVIVAVLISIALSHLFEAPFLNINHTIQLFVKSNRIDTEKASKTKLEEFAFLHNFMQQAFNIAGERDVLRQKISDNAAQVSHDIRSPLSALNILTGNEIVLPDRPKLLIKDAVSRISDIVSDLDKYRIQTKKSEKAQEHLLLPIITSIIAEKRVEYRYQPQYIIELKVDSSSYDAFVFLESSTLKRVISNIVNNSIESFKNDIGKIKLKLEKIKDQTVISIIDNGKGIPESKLGIIFEKGVSFQKKEGTGLGLSQAKSYIESVGGRINILSQEYKGTEVQIELPALNPPSWYVDRLAVKDNTIISVIDDDRSIYQLWVEKLSLLGLNRISYHSSPEIFMKWHQENYACSNYHYIFLVDYEFINSQKTGLDIIRQCKLHQDAVLVTSQYEKIVSTHLNENLKLIPKDLIRYLPVNIAN